MKTKLFLLATLLIGSWMFVACDDDDDNINVPGEYQSVFDALYPQAKNVRWERERNYYVAEFWRSEMNAEAEAWFDQQKQWKMTVTEIAYNAFPQTIKDAFQSGEYGSWRIDDTDLVERPEEATIYVIEVEKNRQEFDLYYAEDGTLLKVVPDDNIENNYLN